MSATGNPELDHTAADAGLSSQMAAQRARAVTVRNNRPVCWLTMGFGIAFAFIGLCMMLMIISVLTPLSAIGFMSVLAALQWGLGGLMMCFMCPALWKWGLTMLHNKIALDAHGADFVLGTQKKPQEVLIPWDEMTAIQQKRVGNALQFTILGTGGSYAQFTSYSFFRAKHVARMVAERAGLTIESV